MKTTTPIVIGAIASLLALGTMAQDAHATLALTVLDNGNPVAGTETNVGGTLTFNGANAAFTSISITVTGVPAVPSPDLGTINVDAHTAGLIGGQILTIAAVQSGLTGWAGGNVSSTFTTNTLIGSPGPQIFANKFAGTTIASHDFPVGTTTDTFSAVTHVAANAGPFTDEQDLTATFGGAASQLLQTSAQLKAVATPEPAALGVFAIGLLGLGIAYRRRRA